MPVGRRRRTGVLPPCGHGHHADLPGRRRLCAEKSDACGEGATTGGDGATQDGGATEGAASVSVPTERAASPADGRLAEDPVVEAPLADTDRRGLTEEQRAALEGVRDLEVSPELREIIGRAMKAAFVREERQ